MSLNTIRQHSVPPSLHPSSSSHKKKPESPDVSSRSVSPSFISPATTMTGPIVWPVLAAALVYFLLQRKSHPALKHIPYVKYNAWLPGIFNRFLYYPKAASMIYWGYEKVGDT